MVVVRNDLEPFDQMRGEVFMWCVSDNWHRAKVCATEDSGPPG